jgi:lactate permease
MFHQQLTPVANSLGLSCLVAAIPVLTVLLLLGVLRRPAWQAASAGLLLALIMADDVDRHQRATAL